MILIKEITKRLNLHPRVVVFTQDLEMAKMFLVTEDGHWTVNVNSRYWRLEDFAIPGITFGHSASAGKVIVGNHTHPTVGFDKEASRLVFTKNPFFPLQPKDFVIKDQFYFGDFKIVQAMNYSAAIESWKPVVICARDLHHYFHVNDNLTMLDIPFSTKSSSKILPIHLMNYVTPVQVGTTVIAYGFKSIYEILTFHEAKSVILVYDKDYDIPTFERVEEIMRCFLEAPDQAITPEYISFKTMSHEQRVRRDLEFMALSGALKTGQTHVQEVTIRKKVQDGDEMFQRIPEGTWRIDKLMAHLVVSRDNLIGLFKNYRDSIDFTYVPSNHNLFYFAKNDMTSQRYSAAKQFFSTNLQAIKTLEIEGMKYLNREIEARLEKHCLGNGLPGVIHQWGKITEIDPCGKLMAFDAYPDPRPLDQGSESQPGPPLS